METTSILKLPLGFAGLFVRQIEKFMFILVTMYDDYMYTPIQKGTSPIVEKIPRSISINGKTYTIFTANIVSWSRTLLIVPVATCLKYGYFWSVFWLVVLHDFLDHVDGIVAKVHKKIYGPVDDPILGGFMDAFCDKVVNITCLWTILMVSNFAFMTWAQCTIYLGTCVIIIVYESVIGVVRVQDYFYAKHKQHLASKHGPTSKENQQSATASVMEGKLKEKLESMGIACLGLAQGAPNAMKSWAGLVGVVCLILSVRLAHASLTRKLDARKKKSTSNPFHMATVDYHLKIDYSNKPLYNEDGSKKTYPKKSKQSAVTNGITSSNGIVPNGSSILTAGGKDANNGTSSDSGIVNGGLRKRSPKSRTKVKTFSSQEIKKARERRSSSTTSTGESDSEEERKRAYHSRRRSMPFNHLDGRVDKVYTVGCFDLFHQGHILLLQRMRAIGRQVIVGVHDTRSIYRLKNKITIDSTEKRMLNIKQYADQVYCISSTDPSNFLTCIVNLEANETALYVRGDDMPNFPSRLVVENLMPIQLLPYTQGVSSTKLRKELYAKIRAEDDSYVSDIN